MLKVGDNTKIQVLPNNKIALLDKDYIQIPTHSIAKTEGLIYWLRTELDGLPTTHCLLQQDCVKDLSEMKQAVPSG